MTILEFEKKINSHYPYEVNLKITLDDAGSIVDWSFELYDITGDEKYEDKYDNYDELAEFIEDCHKWIDCFDKINLHRYGNSLTASAILYKPTNQIIGYRGTYDSWQGTDFSEKFIANIKEVVKIVPCDMKII